MRRLVTLALTLLSFLALFPSCEKAPFITMIGPRTFNFTRDGGTQTFAFSCNRDWSVSSSDSWVTISPSSGAAADGDITVTIKVSPNTTYDSRTATVTLKVEELTEMITVTQDTGLGLIVSPTTFDLTNAEQTIEVEVQQNVNYSIEIDEACKDWIKKGDTKALSTDKVVFNIAANKTYDNREGKITFKQTDGDLSQTVTVKQSQTDGLFVTTYEYELSNTAQTINVEVNANIGFDVHVDEVWIKYVETKALSQSTVVLSIEANETYYKRTGTVEIKQANGELSESIIIKQAQTDALFITDESKEYSVPSKGGEVFVNVFHNIPFELEGAGLGEWLTVSSSDKDAYNTTLSISVGKNTLYKGRETNIKIKGRDLLDSFSINQHQVDIVYTDISEYKSEWKGGEFSVNIYSNTEYLIDLPEWITMVSEEKTYNEPLTINTIKLLVEENLDIERQGCISVLWKNEGEDSSCSLIVSQECCTISLTEAGKLLETLGEERYKKVKKLVIGGDLNGTDILMIRRMSSLKIIDLSNSRIIPGGSAYYENYYSSQDCIGDYMFSFLNTIQEMILPNGLVSIGPYAFSHNESIQSLTLPNTIKTIGDSAFDNCNSLKDINIPSSITRLENGVFNNSGIEHISIPNSVNYIGWYAFGACWNLKEITIPRSVKSLGGNCFMYCYSLAEIHFKPLPDEIALGESIFPDSYKKATLYIPTGTYDKYFLTELGNFETIIEE